MNAKAIRDAVGAEPFAPFVIVVSSGDRYEVRHPENVLLLKERVVVGYFESDGDDLPDRSTSISYLHIAAIEPAPRTRRRPARSTAR